MGATRAMLGVSDVSQQHMTAHSSMAKRVSSTSALDSTTGLASSSTKGGRMGAVDTAFPAARAAQISLRGAQTDSNKIRG